MARTSREFLPSKEMRDMAEQLWALYSDDILGNEELMSTDSVWFAFIVSKKAKNSGDIQVKTAQDWQREGELTSYSNAVLIYQDSWDGWDIAQKQRKLFTALAYLSGCKYDVQDFVWLQTAIGPTFDEKGGLKAECERPYLLDVDVASTVKTAFILATKELEDDDEAIGLGG